MSVTYKTGPRAVAARGLRSVASRIWDAAKLGEARYMTETDLVLINVVGHIDGLANRLDPPY